MPDFYRNPMLWYVLVAAMLAVFLFGDVLVLLFLGGMGEARSLQETGNSGYKAEGESVLRISDIHEPSIGSGAAMTEDTGSSCLVYGGECSSLPSELWVGLLLAYIVLLIANFYYGSRKFSGNIQWFWEASYTALALIAWYVFDGCRTHVWFPLYVLKTGAVTFAGYLYFVGKKTPAFAPLSEEVE